MWNKNVGCARKFHLSILRTELMYIRMWLHDLRHHWLLDYCHWVRRSVAVSLVFLHLAALGWLLSIELANALNCRYRVCLYMASAVHLMYVSMYVAYVWLSVGKYLCISNSVCGMYCKDVCTYVLCCVCPVQDMTLVHTGSITACIGSSQKFTWHRWPWMMMLIDKIIVCLYVGLAICECLARHTFLST